MRTLYFVPCRHKGDGRTRVWSAVGNTYSEAVEVVLKDHPEVAEFMTVKDNKFTNEWAEVK